MNILITGACGLVARSVIDLLGQNHSLRLLDRTAPAEATMYAGLGERKKLPLQTDWPFIQGSITDPATLLGAMDGIECVVHLAGHPTGLPEEGFVAFESNALGTFCVLDAARLAGVRRVFCASSINAFGTIFWRLSGRPAPYVSMPLTEDFEPVPEDPYSLSKLVGEETCAAFARAYDITAIAFRFAGVFSDESYEGVKAAGLPPTTAWNDALFGWVHHRDVADGIRRAVEAPVLPRFAAYTLGGPDTRCPEPTMEILERFRPDLAANVTALLPGRAPLLAIDRARLAFDYAPSHRLGD